MQNPAQELGNPEDVPRYRRWLKLLSQLVATFALASVVFILIYPPRSPQPGWLARGAILRYHGQSFCDDCSGSLLISDWLIPVPIRHFSDFNGLARIATPNDALAFCRFGDYNPEFPLGGERHSEIRLGENQYLDVSGSSVSKKLWLTSGLKDPTVVRAGKFWIITRPSIIEVPPNRDPVPFIVTERVGLNGSYSLLKKEPIAVKLGKDDRFEFLGMG